MKTLAAVLVETGKPLELVELRIPDLKPGQVLVEIAFSGVCHTQVLEARGHRGEDRYLPHCLGHEGSGTVREVGTGVTKVKPGDKAILSWIKGSGMDVPGSVYDWNGKPVNAGGITTFQRFAVLSENRLTPLRAEAGTDSVSLRDAALIGCAIPTGMGAVLNTARPRPGESLAVFGVGGVGVCAVMAASLAGCVPLIAVDVHEHKLDLARKLGATHCVNSAQQDLAAELARICPGGLDFAVEATGRPAVMLQALSCVRNQGGAAVIVGNAHFGEQLTLDPRQLNQGKRLLGTWGGDNWPDRDYPRYCRLLAAGKFSLDPIQSEPYALADVNRALADLEAARVPRPLVDMSL